jgi:hypothetical protein
MWAPRAGERGTRAASAAPVRAGPPRHVATRAHHAHTCRAPFCARLGSRGVSSPSAVVRVCSALGPAGRINGERQTAAAAFTHSLGPEDAALARGGAESFRKEHPAGAPGALKAFKELSEDEEFAVRNLGCSNGGVRRSRPHTATEPPRHAVAIRARTAQKHTRACTRTTPRARLPCTPPGRALRASRGFVDTGSRWPAGGRCAARDGAPSVACQLGDVRMGTVGYSNDPRY